MARPRLVSDEQILDATRKAVLRDGPRASLDDIAGELGVTQPAILKRFGSRKALLVAALKPPDEPLWQAALEALPDDRPLKDQLEGLFAHIASILDDFIPCLAALRESGISENKVFEGKAGPRGAVLGFVRLVERMKTRGLVGDVDAESAGIAMLGALQLRAFYNYLLKTDPTRKAQTAQARDLADFFTQTLGARPTKARPEIGRATCRERV